MNDTKDEIIHLAAILVKSVGYNSFSYADISKQLNIKNAAIHYYFPSKSDLGVEIIRLNLQRFKQKVESWRELDYKQQYIQYITMHNDFVDRQWMCVVGSMAPLFDTLPINMQQELQKLTNVILSFLTDLLTEGKNAGVFVFEESPLQKAYMIHSALLSALLMNKVLQNDIYKQIQEVLLNI